MILSIVIPVYNTDINKLIRCVNSVLKIRNIEFEIILIDDGSEEKFHNEYLKINDLHVRLITKPNGGVSSARNVGIEQSSGKYIMFVDSDDVINAEVLERDFLNEDVDFISYNIYYVNNNGKKIYKNKLNLSDGLVSYNIAIEKFITDCCYYSVNCQIYKSDFIRRYNLRFNESMIQGEDAVFNLDFLRLEPVIKHYNKPLYGYYFDITNTMSRLQKNTDLVLQNLTYLIKRKKEIIEALNRIELVENVNIELIDKLFSFCLEAKESEYIIDFSAQILIQEKVNKKALEKKYRVKYMLIINKKIFIIKILAICRKIYLKYFKHIK